MKDDEESKKDCDSRDDERIPKELGSKIGSAETVFLVEGVSDESFIEGILKEIKYNRKYVVRPINGNSFHKFIPEILGNWAAESYKKGKIIIIADNDKKGSFETIRQELCKEFPTDKKSPKDKVSPKDNKSTPVFKIPDRPDQFAGGRPDCCIIMLPDANRLGCLETLLLEAAKQEHPELYCCAKVYYDCVRSISSDDWSESKKAKLLFRVMFAAYHKRNPDLSVTHLWKDCPDLAPIESKVFDGIKERLRRLLEETASHSPPPAAPPPAAATKEQKRGTSRGKAVKAVNQRSKRAAKA